MKAAGTERIDGKDGAQGTASRRDIRVEDVEHRQPDGTVLLLRTFSLGEPRRAILLLPDMGESLSDGLYDALARSLLSPGTVAYAVELRGHTLSQGRWSLHAHRVDIAYLIAHLRRLHGELFVVASGISASTMLEYDDQAHRFPSRMPPLPSGMLLLSPTFSGKDALPKATRPKPAMRRIAPALHDRLVLRALRGKGGAGYGHCRIDRAGARVFWDELSAYRFGPVRVQTPSAMLVPMDTHAEPLKRVFGNVRLMRFDWLPSLRRRDIDAVELAQHLHEISAAFASVAAAERPIRFRG